MAIDHNLPWRGTNLGKYAPQPNQLAEDRARVDLLKDLLGKRDTGHALDIADRIIHDSAKFSPRQLASYTPEKIRDLRNLVRAILELGSEPQSNTREISDRKIIIRRVPLQSILTNTQYLQLLAAGIQGNTTTILPVKTIDDFLFTSIWDLITIGANTGYGMVQEAVNELAILGVQVAIPVNAPHDQLNLHTALTGTRTPRKVLAVADINTLDALLAKSAQELGATPGFTEGQVNKIITALAKHKLLLRDALIDPFSSRTEIARILRS